MKKLLLITALILFTIAGFSQRNISVIRVSTDTVKAFSATKTLSLKDTVKIDYADIDSASVRILTTGQIGYAGRCINLFGINNVNGCSKSVNFPDGVTIEDSLVFTNGAGEGKVLTSDANGVASWNAFDFSKLCLPANAGETLLFFNGCLYVADSNEKAIDGITDTTYTFDDANIRCQNKGVGWYLPTKMELDFIYQVWNQPANGGTYQGGATPLSGFSSSDYWSSSEGSSGSGWGQYFSDGYQNYYGKDTSYKVRCVRR